MLESAQPQMNAYQHFTNIPAQIKTNLTGQLAQRFKKDLYCWNKIN